MAEKVLLSLVIPAFNEEKNIKPLYEKIKRGLSDLRGGYEIILVSDGSTDRTEEEIKKIQRRDRRVVLRVHQKSLGKSAALGTGLEVARGEVIALIDADLQDEPAEIPKLMEKLSQGYDLVVGWRARRRDAAFKIITSKMMNLLIFLLSGVKLHDFYCPLKCYRREVLGKLDLYGELYRLIPILAHQKGLRITELPVAHYHRKFGKSKYSGIKRFKRALTDLAVILFVIKSPRMPLLIFNLFGLIFSFLGLRESICGDLIYGVVLTGLGLLFFCLVFVVKMFVKRQVWREERRKIHYRLINNLSSKSFGDG